MHAEQLIRIFCEIDDFCKEYSSLANHKLLPSNKSSQKRGVKPILLDSEIMTILVLFQSSGIRTFKLFYTYYLPRMYQNAFPNLLSYNRFTEVMGSVMSKLALFAYFRSGKRTGIYFIDSTCLPVCHLKRSSRNKTFRDIAEYGHTSVGWFFGLKFHLVINERGELMAFKFTRGHTHDSTVCEHLLGNLQGLAFGDKGYLGKEILARLLKKGLKLVTKVRKNMKKPEYSNLESQLLKQRGIIETVINHFKHRYQIWHTRHRSVFNAMTHLVAGIAAYVLEPLKISAIKLLSTNS